MLHQLNEACLLISISQKKLRFKEMNTMSKDTELIISKSGFEIGSIRLLNSYSSLHFIALLRQFSKEHQISLFSFSNILEPSDSSWCTLLQLSQFPGRVRETSFLPHPAPYLIFFLSKKFKVLSSSIKIIKFPKF